MPDRPTPAPYYLPRQFAPLRWYEQRGLSAHRWAEEQFQLEVRAAASSDPSFESRCGHVLTAMDGLPLQVKDLLRGTIDEVDLAPASEFEVDTLGTWRDGQMRINVEWGAMAPLSRHDADPLYTKRVLQDTLVHECGHALLEDPRGGVPLKSFVHLLAASGWLPHPTDDPIPFRWSTASPEALTNHYLRQLQQIDPRWDPELPLGAPRTPPPLQLDQDLMWQAPLAIHPLVQRRGTLGLRQPAQLGRELLAAAVGGTLSEDLSKVSLSLTEVRAAINRHQPVSPYAGELISETPAELFRTLHCGQPLALSGSPALEAGDRLLIGPWRVAELELGPREPARVPMRARGNAEMTR